MVFSTSDSVEFKHIFYIKSKYLPVLHADPALYQILSGGYMSVVRKTPTLGNMRSTSFVQTTHKKPLIWLKRIFVLTVHI